MPSPPRGTKAADREADKTIPRGGGVVLNHLVKDGGQLRGRQMAGGTRNLLKDLLGGATRVKS